MELTNNYDRIPHGKLLVRCAVSNEDFDDEFTKKVEKQDIYEVVESLEHNEDVFNKGEKVILSSKPFLPVFKADGYEYFIVKPDSVLVIYA